MGRDRGFSSWEAPPEGFLDSLPAEIRLEKKRPVTVGKPSVSFSSNPSQVPPAAATVPSPVTQLSPETAAAIDSALFEKKVRVMLLLEKVVVSCHYVSLSWSYWVQSNPTLTHYLALLEINDNRNLRQQL